MKNVFVPVDFSDSTLQLIQSAANLAGKMKTEMVLYHSVEAFLAPLSSDFTGLEPLAYQEMVTSLGVQYETRLKELAEPVVAAGIPVTTEVGFGRAHLMIADAAEKYQSDCIVIGKTGHTRLHYILLGSTTERLLRVTNRPVISVNTAHPTGFETISSIGLPLDFSEEALQIFPMAIRFAKLLGAGLHLVHVDALAKYLDAELDIYPDLLTRFPDLVGIPVKRTILSGDNVTGALLEFGQTQGIDLWMQTSQGSGFLTSLFIGSRADSLIRQAEQPVFTMRILRS